MSKDMNFTVSLNEKTAKKFQAIKDYFGVQEDQSVIALLITEKYDGVRKVRMPGTGKGEMNTMEKTDLCSNCRLNPKAKKPYVKMKILPTDDKTIKALEGYAQRNKVLFECAPCKIVQDLVSVFKE